MAAAYAQMYQLRPRRLNRRIGCIGDEYDALGDQTHTWDIGRCQRRTTGGINATSLSIANIQHTSLRQINVGDYFEHANQTRVLLLRRLLLCCFISSRRNLDVKAIKDYCGKRQEN
jgi:hypothetical protein